MRPAARAGSFVFRPQRHAASVFDALHCISLRIQFICQRSKLRCRLIEDQVEGITVAALIRDRWLEQKHADAERGAGEGRSFSFRLWVPDPPAKAGSGGSSVHGDPARQSLLCLRQRQCEHPVLHSRRDRIPVNLV